jgi:hypothetical protein
MKRNLSRPLCACCALAAGIALATGLALAALQAPSANMTIAWSGGEWYLYGVNYPWKFYGEDFTSVNNWTNVSPNSPP